MRIDTNARAWRCSKTLLMMTLATLFFCNAMAQDASLAQRIRERTAVALRDGSDELARFYAERQFAPAWTALGRRAALAAALDSLREDGLDPADYPLEPATSGSPLAAADVELEQELSATVAYLRALRHLRHGKVDHALVDMHDAAARSSEGDAATDAVGVDDVRARFAQARIGGVLRPCLRDALQRLREIEAAGGWPYIDAGPTLKLGTLDPRVALLRARLVAGSYLPATDAGDAAFDAVLEQAVRDFQSEQYLEVDGKAGPATLAALNQPLRARIDQVRVNLERARQLLRGFGDNYVTVDIAGFKVLHHRDGLPDWRARAQVGRPYRSTPSLRSDITAITFNPTWTVPPTILRNDILPRLRSSTAYLAKNRMRVFDAHGNEVAAGAVDWRKPGGLTLRQDAGADNALGRVVILFPNPYDVYMHDTPHAELFAREQRAFSSGCIRIERPLELVERLLADTPGWDHDAIDQAVAVGTTRTVNLTAPVPVILAYWSVDTHNGERIAFKPDLYGQDARILLALDAPVVGMPFIDSAAGSPRR